MESLKLKSRRFNKEYPAELYEKDGCLIIRHSSLDQIFWSIPDGERPVFSIEPFDMSRMPFAPAMFAVKCILSTKNVHIEQVGEFLCDTWNSSNPVMKDNPLATCQNRAFDKAFIRFMAFDISAYEVAALYSSAEIPVDGMVPLTDKNVSANMQKDAAPAMQAPPMTGDAMNASQAATGNGMPPVFNQTGAAPVPQMQGAVVHQEYQPYSITGIPDEMDADPFGTPDMMAGFPMGMPIDPAMQGPEAMPPMPDFGDIQYGAQQMPDIPAAPPLPWMNAAPQGKQHGTPGAPPSADAGIPAAPAPQPNVRRVSYEPVFQKAKVETDCGTFFFANGTWESPSVDVRLFDLNSLYARASEKIGCDLSRFHGFMEP